MFNCHSEGGSCPRNLLFALSREKAISPKNNKGVRHSRNAFVTLNLGPEPKFLGSRQEIYLKLATASASVLYTSNTVSSFVICSTSWNFDPRWHSFSAAFCDFAL